ncbi:MAG: Glu/Leu/Phe/Val dehydrogenase [Alphaproteobacteria bacterium]|nr:Glu/Leu/Phe/Val dehydrogenase [Alphaproteobacteria bacterium]
MSDDLGPYRSVHIRRPGVGLEAFVVIDNTARGPAIGGVRMAPDAGLEEARRLARAMTLKNAAADLAHGGGKSVIVADPTMAPARKEQLVRAFADSIRDLGDYIPGPDMGTDEGCMAWVKDEIGRAVGLPRELGGIPLDVIGATGLGLVAAIEAAQRTAGIAIKGARVAVQGFGAVGKHAARFLAERGAVLVAASDSRGTLVDPDGLDVAALIALKAAGRPLSDHDRGDKRERDAVIDVACEIWIPAARPDVIRTDNVGRLKARLVAEGANIPLDDAAERALHAGGVVVLPDFIANAGGVICAAVEYRGGSEAQARSAIVDKIAANTASVLAESARSGEPPRSAALALAERRVRAAMALRRFR